MDRIGMGEKQSPFQRPSSKYTIPKTPPKMTRFPPPDCEISLGKED